MSVFCSRVPVSQIFNSLSAPPLASALPSGLKARLSTGAEWASICLSCATVCHVPKPDELILPGGGKRLAIWREGDGKNRPVVRRPSQALGQVGGVPKGNFSLISGALPAVMSDRLSALKRERADTPGQAVECPRPGPVCGVPKNHFSVSTGGQVLAVRAPCDGLNDVAVAGELGQAGRFSRPRHG